jgi:DNA-binding transcriptional LysR family regulator
MILAGPLMASAEKHAPNVTFQILSDRAQVVQSELRYGETDIAIDHEPLHDDGMHSELLYEDPFYLLSRRNHPGITPGSTVTHETFLDLSHIGLSWTRTKGDSPITQRLARSGFERDLRMKVPTIGAVGAVISQTNLVCAASLRVAQHFARLWPLAIHPLDINLPPVPIHMIWHSRFDSDPGHAWLRAALREAAATA